MARTGGMPVRAVLARRWIEFDAFRNAVEQDVPFANITIIEGIGASQYGMGHGVSADRRGDLSDEHALFPVVPTIRFRATVSPPSIVGRQGVIEVLEPEMSDKERLDLERGAARLRETVHKHLVVS